MVMVVPSPDLEGHRKVYGWLVDAVPRPEQVGGLVGPYLVDLERPVVMSVEVLVSGNDVEAPGFLPHLLKDVYQLFLGPADLKGERCPFLAGCVEGYQGAQIGLERVVGRFRGL